MEPVVRGRTVPVQPVEGRREPINILVVDDDADIAELLTLLLGEHGSVKVVPDAYQALAWLDQGEVDVMVLDLSLPGANGVELLGRLEQRGTSVPAVVLTAYPRDGSLAQLAVAAGATAVLSKPFDGDELVGTVLSVSRRRDPPRP